MKLLSDQVNAAEIAVIVRELQKVIDGGVNGDVVEFGCYIGTTSVFIAKELVKTNKQFYVYDSFEGLPEKSVKDTSAIGGQFKAGELIASKKQFIINMKKSGVPMPIIKKAWFCELTQSDIPPKIAFAFLDGDYYDSITDSFKAIEHNLSPGAIIIVDDYGNDSLPGARKAVDEWLIKHPSKFRIEQSLAIIYIV